MSKIVVLGAGLVGSAMAIDLAKNHEVTSVDVNEEALLKLKAHNLATYAMNLRDDNALQNFVKDFDLVIGAVPGFMGFNTVKQVILAGKNMVDISFFPEDPFKLDELAKKHGVVVVTDCGVAPGMGNIILGHHNRLMKIKRYECLVGGLPVVREWPFEYKAVFSPIDVIEEYVRPARYVQNGQMVVREALSDAELIPFPGLGTLESWNSDGLRSLIKTMPHIPDMIEKTLRYPGCIEYLRVLRAAGFFSYEEVEVNGAKIRPIDLTSKLLFPKWKLKPGEEDFTIMRIVMEGEEDNKPCTYTYHLLDRYDQSSQTISMARTTGYTCNAVANLVLDKKFARVGINPPELVGDEEGCYDAVVKYLKDRNVHYSITKS
ncbi:MAG: saccharopine dehydrogenase C-terminal domain-containing protein [Flavobacteriales bacterium]